MVWATHSKFYKLSREHLSEEDHAHILQKMVAGSIASRETIIESLDRSGLPLSVHLQLDLNIHNHQ
jgi:hypothetical protein